MLTDKFQQSYDRVKQHVQSSPLIISKWLSDELKAEVYLKLECLQPGHSFKIRGATNALLSHPKTKKVVTASGGNHGLGVAIACSRQSIPCHIVLPNKTSKHRIDLLISWNATVQLYGDSWDDANVFALKLAEEKDTLYIHAFADEEVILGQGTIGVELAEQIPHIEVLMASVGGGGLLYGTAAALASFGIKPKIVSVETLGADSFTQSIKAGKIVELPAITSIAATLGARKTVPLIFDNLSPMISHALTVSDKEAVQGMIDFLEHEKILVEPATACNIAALLKNKDIFKGQKVVIIVCGSNLTMDELKSWKLQFDLE